VLSHPSAPSLWAATAPAAPPTPPLAAPLTTTDVLVIGAGYTGLSAALHLAESGARVCVLDAHAPGWGASGRNGGQVNPTLKYDPDELQRIHGAARGERLIDAVSRSADLVYGLIERHGIDCAPVRAGWLQVGYTQQAVDGMHARARQWERRGVTTWSFGDLPESIHVEDVAGSPLLAWTGLAVREAEVDVRLFHKPEDAESSTVPAIRKLGEILLARDLVRVRKDLGGIGKPIQGGNAARLGFHGALDQLSTKLQPTAPSPALSKADALEHSACEHLLNHLLVLHPLRPLTQARFIAMLESARRDLPGRTHSLVETIKQIVALRQKILSSPKRYTGMERDVQRLAGDDFPARTPHAQLAHLPRFLRAIQIRGERADLSPAKDTEKAKNLAPFLDWEKRVPADRREAFRWMLEEYRVSIFAQELGTSQPVSAVRLKEIGGF
jgi:hypothetical protein